MKKKAVSICCFLILNSCGKCIETNLTSEEKVWFSVYEKSQNIIFKSNLGHFDTIVVTEKVQQHNNSDCNYYGIGPMQPEIMFITLNSKICHNEPYCKGEIFISKDKVDKIFTPSFSLFGLYNANNNSLPKETWLILRTTKKKYSNVYIFEDGINAKNSGNNYLTSFYWDKKEGLIRYDTSDGEVFEILEKRLK
jgi:signal peptidase I